MAHPPPRRIKALYFDVFGTVTDWYSRVVAEGSALSEQTGISVPWGEFALKWRIDGYYAALKAIAAGEMDYLATEDIHRRKLDQLLEEYRLTGLDEETLTRFNLVWNRIGVWDDVPEGLAELKRDFMILPFSNGDLRCLVEISRQSSLPWDGIISAGFFGKVKPDPTIYQDAADLMLLDIREVMLVAAHPMDLSAARRAGMGTAYVARPMEYGPDHPMEPKPETYDYEVTSFVELAAALREGAA